MSENPVNDFLFEEEQNGAYVTFLFPPADIPADGAPQASDTEKGSATRRVFQPAGDIKEENATDAEPRQEDGALKEEDLFFEDTAEETAPTSKEETATSEEPEASGSGETAEAENGSEAKDEAGEEPAEDPAPESDDRQDLGLSGYGKGKTKLTDREEIKLHYVEAGVGEPLLLIHGIGQSVYTWRNVFQVLSENYRVIAVDLPGHGKSSRPELFSYSMDEMAEVLHEFLAAKGIESAHMVGFSTGAVYMMRLLTLHPENVANCIAIAPGGISRYMPKLYHRLKKTVTGVFARNLYSERTVEKILADAVSTDNFFTDEDVRQYYEPVSDGLTREALMYAVMNFDLKGTAEELKETEHEILCVWGRDDNYHPVSGSVYFQKVIPGGRFYLIRGAGHLVHEELPEKILDVILSYIPSAVTGYDRYPYPQTR